MMAKAIKEDAMATHQDWEARAKGLLKGELKRRNLTYAQLVSRLAEIGIKEDEHNLRNKVARGKFTAAFLLQCLEAMGVTDVRIRH
jgi:3-mercaptopyruvate sulfurtransferase SseA